MAKEAAQPRVLKRSPNGESVPYFNPSQWLHTYTEEFLAIELYLNKLKSLIGSVETEIISYSLITTLGFYINCEL